MEGKSCFTNLSTFNNEIIDLVDEDIAGDVAYADFCKVFNTVLASYTSWLHLDHISEQWGGSKTG